MRLALLLALLVSAAATEAAAQVQRGVFASYSRDGGSSELTEPRFAVHAGYAVGGAGPSGAYAGARYVVGAHLLRAGEAAYAERWGAGEVEGGGGMVYDTGKDVELGWKVGPVRPYWYTGYHYHRQTLDAATLTTSSATVDLPMERTQGFARGGGYGAMLLLSGGSGVYAERFRGGGGEVMEVDGIRFGLRLAW
jgi:hypothetical protein